MVSLPSALLALALAGPTAASLDVRGRTLDLALYGQRGRPPVLLASADVGGERLGPGTATLLAGHGYFVVCVDAEEYLSAFTAKGGTLSPADVAGDFALLVDFAARGARVKPVLVGVSEGAGLAVLAAVDPVVKQAVRGVVAVGLRDRNELVWRPDWILAAAPEAAKRPHFSVAAIVDKLAPVALAQVRLTDAGAVPLAETRRLHDRAGEPRRMWAVDPGARPLSDETGELAGGLLEAMGWVAPTP
jgi:type IV secretory pathway VirJ component